MRGNDGEGASLDWELWKVSPRGDIVTETFLMGRGQPRGRVGAVWGGGQRNRVRVEGTAPAKALRQHQAWALYQDPRRARTVGAGSQRGVGSGSSQAGRSVQGQPSLECGLLLIRGRALCPKGFPDFYIPGPPQENQS